MNYVGKDQLNIMERYFAYCDRIDPDVVKLFVQHGFNKKLLKMEDLALMNSILNPEDKGGGGSMKEITMSVVRRGSVAEYG